MQGALGGLLLLVKRGAVKLLAKKSKKDCFKENMQLDDVPLLNDYDTLGVLTREMAWNPQLGM